MRAVPFLVDLWGVLIKSGQFEWILRLKWVKFVSRIWLLILEIVLDTIFLLKNHSNWQF